MFCGNNNGNCRVWIIMIIPVPVFFSGNFGTYGTCGGCGTNCGDDCGRGC